MRTFAADAARDRTDVHHRGLLLRLLLAWVLVLQPVGAVSHAWSHLGGHEAPHQDDQHASAHAACELCVAYAHTGAALPSTAIHCADRANICLLPELSPASLPPPARAAHHARGPPHVA